MWYDQCAWHIQNGTNFNSSSPSSTNRNSFRNCQTEIFLPLVALLKHIYIFEFTSSLTAIPSSTFPFHARHEKEILFFLINFPLFCEQYIRMSRAACEICGLFLPLTEIVFASFRLPQIFIMICSRPKGSLTISTFHQVSKTSILKGHVRCLNFSELVHFRNEPTIAREHCQSKRVGTDHAL